jgi:DNA-binding NarL/FixJ family response regulator
MIESLDRIKLTITDDHPMIRDGLKYMLSTEEDMVIVSEYGKGKHMLSDLHHNMPDVLLLDLQLADIHGEELVPVLIKKYPALKIIILTSNNSIYSIKKLMNMGVQGYILKNTEQGLLAQAIRCVYEEGIFISPELQSKLLRISHQHEIVTAANNQLTPRETEVLKLIARELTSQEIGNELSLSYRTVENYRQVIMQKLGVKNTVGLLKKAILLGLIDE